MRVLWLCNIMLPVIAEQLGKPASNKEGWLSGLAQQILLHKEENQIELGICYPVPKGQGTQNGEAAGISYFEFEEDTIHPENYDYALETQLADILNRFDPDVVHCFGTEYPHTLAMTKACQDKSKVLIGIQGLCYLYADRYFADLPERIVNRYLFRDLVKRDNIRIGREKYVKRGVYEKEALALAGNITGRTDWDRAAAAECSPNATYHFMNETLRSNFYSETWEYDKCEPYSIFLSQGNYPIKGLHYMLQAMPKILARFPEAKVYVAGDVITRYESLKDKIKIGSYGKYCLDLIRSLNLQGKIEFVGRLDAQQMCNRYLKSHVFVSPSSIENSPNSVGEAMLLGMPVVSSDVGGVANMLTHGKEGILYPYFDVDALSEAVCQIFEDKEQAIQMGVMAREHAQKTHDGDANYARLMEIYHQI
ncbi:MAG: glycosyltransferase family 4 protein [Lachnospiraceae bacterium]|nr:glycosyltransferase family 4 protein [Lachnospiraceae bacterium]